jgi:hypothetical protein
MFIIKYSQTTHHQDSNHHPRPRSTQSIHCGDRH